MFGFVQTKMEIASDDFQTYFFDHIDGLGSKPISLETIEYFQPNSVINLIAFSDQVSTEVSESFGLREELLDEIYDGMVKTLYPFDVLRRWSCGIDAIADVHGIADTIEAWYTIIAGQKPPPHLRPIGRAILRKK